MHARERIVRERFAEQTCTHCGAHYPAEGVIVLARRRSTWMVMATCTRCQQRGLFVVSFPEAHRSDEQLGQSPPSTHFDAPNIFPGTFLPTAPETTTHEPADTPQLEQSGATHPDTPPALVTVNDVNEMHEFLASFNGDFNTLFARIHPQSSDDSST